MNDLCVAVIVIVLIIIFGNLAFSIEPYNRAIYPINDETINMNRTSRNLGDWWEHIEEEE